MNDKEIELNSLKVGEIVECEENCEDGCQNRTLWLVYRKYTGGVFYFIQLAPPVSVTGGPYLGLKLGFCLSSNPVRIYAGQLRVGSHPLRTPLGWEPQYYLTSCGSRSWKKLPAEELVTVEIKVPKGTTEVEVNGKKVKL